MQSIEPGGTKAASYVFCDFAVYYIAGKVADGKRDPVLYYPTDRSWSTNPTGRYVDAQTEWDAVGRANGLASVQHYIYPPLFVTMMIPFSRFSLESAYFAWRELNFLALIVSIYVALRWLKAKPFWPVFTLSCIGGVCFFPYNEAAYLGQVGVILLLMWALGVLWAEERPVCSALCLALGTMLKLTPVIALPLLVMRRKWRWVLAYLAWMILLMAISIWRLGWNNEVLYFSKVLPSISQGYPLATNVSLQTVLQSIYLRHVFLTDNLASNVIWTPSWIRAAFKVLAAMIYLGTLIFFWKWKGNNSRLSVELLALVPVTILAAPVVWRHSYVTLLLPLIFLWARDEDFSNSTITNALLALATVTVGTVLPEFVLAHTRVVALQIALQASMPLAAAILLFILLRHVQRGTGQISCSHAIDSPIAGNLTIEPHSA
jgi:hypothetical protein